MASKVQRTGLEAGTQLLDSLQRFRGPQAIRPGSRAPAGSAWLSANLGTMSTLHRSRSRPKDTGVQHGLCHPACSQCPPAPTSPSRGAPHPDSRSEQDKEQQCGGHPGPLPHHISSGTRAIRPVSPSRIMEYSPTLGRKPPSDADRYKGAFLGDSRRRGHVRRTVGRSLATRSAGHRLNPPASSWTRDQEEHGALPPWRKALEGLCYVLLRQPQPSEAQGASRETFCQVCKASGLCSTDGRWHRGQPMGISGPERGCVPDTCAFLEPQSPHAEPAAALTTQPSSTKSPGTLWKLPLPQSLGPSTWSL